MDPVIDQFDQDPTEAKHTDNNVFVDADNCMVKVIEQR